MGSSQTANMKTIVLCLLVAGAIAAPHTKPRYKKGLNRIVGGDEVAPGELPYQLSFQDISFGSPFHFCGASIYNENWAICAGHCVQGEDFENPDYLRIVAGEHNLDLEEGNEQNIVLSQIIQHEDYNSFTLVNDISLLKFSEPLVFNDFAQPIALPEAGQAASGDCTVSGWGTTSEGGSSPSTLRKVVVPVVTDEVCDADYGGGQVFESMICAGLKEGGKDSCQGDSGGPFVCNDTGSNYLAGVVSWGYGCARPGYPGVYTEVSYFVAWILANAV